MKPWVRADDGSDVETVGYRTVVHKQFTMNDGRTMQADIVSADGFAAVAVVALTPENNVIIARQYRCGPEKICDELPGGLIDPGETPEQAVRRELEEEVGATTDDLTLLGTAYINGWDNAKHYYYLAKNCQYNGTIHFDDFEEIETTEITISELIANAKNARMTDTQGVFLAYDELKQLEEKS